MLEWIITLPRNIKRLIALGCDVTLLPMTMWLSFCLRLDELYVPDARVATVLGLTTLATIAVYAKIGLYRAVIRFVGSQVLTSIFIGVCFSALALTFFGFLLQASVPRSVPFIYFGLSVIAIGGTRLGLRALLRADTRSGEYKVVIYGAGSAGVQLATALTQGVEYHPVAFLDDDRHKWGTVVQDLPIHRPSRLRKLVEEEGVRNVFLAMGRISDNDRARILKYLTQFEVQVKIIPSFADIASGKADIQELRNVEVEDLLGRDSVTPRQELLDGAVKNKTVLVTGAGGSIGSELCRQILRLEPTMLILYELSEFGLYTIEKELQNTPVDGVRPKIRAILGDVRDEPLLTRVMSRWNVDTVYHAAAYKHVPIVEYNLVSGVRTNALGTLRAARAAKTAGVEDFILISTDKAVRPTNFMGATKRVAELILQSMALDAECKTIYSMVRFGNVLGSSGSVVPLFKDQITRGGPVTVTHPDVTRYFMTIPEAVQLVLQASAMSKGGDVFVLDMGEPIKIAMLAQTMIRLMGHTVRDETNPEGDIELQYTGLRPGEKLYEELLLGNNRVGTDHPMIMRATESYLTADQLQEILARIEHACAEFDHMALVSAVRDCVEEYTPGPKIFDYLHADGTENVIELKQPGR